MDALERALRVSWEWRHAYAWAEQFAPDPRRAGEYADWYALEATDDPAICERWHRDLWWRFMGADSAGTTPAPTVRGEAHRTRS